MKKKNVIPEIENISSCQIGVDLDEGESWTATRFVVGGRLLANDETISDALLLEHVGEW